MAEMKYIVVQIWKDQFLEDQILVSSIFTDKKKAEKLKLEWEERNKTNAIIYERSLI